MTEPQTLVDLGARYRFKAGSAPVTLRAQVTNAFDVYRWKVGGNSSFRFIDERRFAELGSGFLSEAAQISSAWLMSEKGGWWSID